MQVTMPSQNYCGPTAKSTSEGEIPAIRPANAFSPSSSTLFQNIKQEDIDVEKFPDIQKPNESSLSDNDVRAQNISQSKRVSDNKNHALPRMEEPQSSNARAP
jgi:hypothetical protein